MRRGARARGCERCGVPTGPVYWPLLHGSRLRAKGVQDGHRCLAAPSLLCRACVCVCVLCRWCSVDMAACALPLQPSTTYSLHAAHCTLTLHAAHPHCTLHTAHHAQRPAPSHLSSQHVDRPAARSSGVAVRHKAVDFETPSRCGELGFINAWLLQEPSARRPSIGLASQPSDCPQGPQCLVAGHTRRHGSLPPPERRFLCKTMFPTTRPSEASHDLAPTADRLALLPLAHIPHRPTDWLFDSGKRRPPLSASVQSGSPGQNLHGPRDRVGLISRAWCTSQSGQLSPSHVHCVMPPCSQAFCLCRCSCAFIPPHHPLLPRLVHARNERLSRRILPTRHLYSLPRHLFQHLLTFDCCPQSTGGSLAHNLTCADTPRINKFH